MENDKLKKCLKSYLMGKKLFETNKDDAFEYFKQSLKYLDILKQNKSSQYTDILLETETECNKYITLTVEETIEKKNELQTDIDLFDIIEKGEIEKLDTIKSYQLKFDIYDDAGMTPIHKAVKFGDTTFLKTCFKLGAPIDITDKNGYTVLEFACLERDPNMISFMQKNGADMRKHLFFRDGIKKHMNKQNYIDFAILLKIIFTYHPIDEVDNEISFIFDFINKNALIGFDEYTVTDLVKCLNSLLNTLDTNIKNTFLNILRDELLYSLKSSLGCPINKIEIILMYLVPFINYPFNMSIDWYINLELKHLIIKLLKKKNILNLETKNELINYLWDTYIKNNLFNDEYVGNLISQWISKIKV
jgi:hypothetical protein